MKFSVADLSFVEARIFRFYHGHVAAIGQGFALYPEHNLTCWWIHKGSVRVKTGDDSSIIAQQGDIFICRPGAPRYQTFSDNALITSVWLNIHWGTLRRYGFEGLPVVLDTEDCPRLTDRCREVEALLERHDVHTIGAIDDCRTSLSDGLKLRALGMDVFSALVEQMMANGVSLVPKEHADPRIAAAVGFLTSKNVSGAVPYEGLTECTGLSRVHLDRLFRKYLKATPKQFLEGQCFERAAELLTGSDMSVNDVAETLNFRSSPHFCSWFKRQSCMTPSEFRKRQVF